MKSEFINMMQILFILTFVIGIITYAIATVKNSIKKFDYNLIRSIYSKSLDYSRFMPTENYVSYEKYDIWRYCVHF